MTRAPDPRGPMKSITSVEEKPNGNFYALECSHTAVHAPHFAALKTGGETRCRTCAKLQEIHWRARP